MWPLVELFANMDMAQLSALVADQVLATFEAQQWSSAAELPGELSTGISICFPFVDNSQPYISFLEAGGDFDSPAAKNTARGGRSPR